MKSKNKITMDYNIKDSDIEKIIKEYEDNHTNHLLNNLNRVGYIYLALDPDNNFVKIGKTSKKVSQRIGNLNTGRTNPIITYKSFDCCNIHEAEAIAHKIFAQHNVIREWFDINFDNATKIVSSIIQKVNEHPIPIKDDLNSSSLAKDYLQYLSGGYDDTVMIPKEQFECLMNTCQKAIKLYDKLYDQVIDLVNKVNEAVECYQHLSQPDFNIWITDVADKHIATIATSFGISHDEAYEIVFKSMREKYSYFWYDSATWLFKDKYHLDEYENVRFIDVIADKPIYQHCFIETVNALLIEGEVTTK